MRTILCFFALVLAASCVRAQEERREKGPAFYVEVSNTEVKQGFSISVSFHLENAPVGDFITPDWEAAGFAVLGSNQSSSISIINGAATSSASYNFVVMPRDTGTLFIPAAVFRSDETELKTEPVKIRVLPNPDGNWENPPSDNPRGAPVKPETGKKKIKTTRI